MAPPNITKVEKSFNAHLDKGLIQDDPAQTDALKALARLERDLSRRQWPLLPRRSVRGVYLHGPVGRGKTFLMNIFYRSIQTEAKLRAHFHSFMLDEIHEPLRRLRRQQDPIPHLAKAIAKRVRVICFDEFLVEDIADAMLLGTLFETLFREGVALVLTANLPPDDLYRSGLQRDRFLPAIAAIKRNCQVISVEGPRDYRAARLDASGVYLVEKNSAIGHQRLAVLFTTLSNAQPQPSSIQLYGRSVPVLGLRDDILFIDFETLCAGYRSPADYLRLATQHRTILLEAIPVLDDQRKEATRRFIALIDILYEHHTILIVSAAAEPNDLYAGNRFRFEFRRTSSRLEEMRSEQYLASSHLESQRLITSL